ncbi:hypothetical protein QBC40DRAFT_264411 [Triangularia verruculosa]|uniref:Apple domain-containing protein n=1 Tax=Triangularia verruculosa TaxID=2587418 RepID=A0AAN6XIB9_9PEZI|nr:hypothetical protein QBC40DRAFT_264411 [Triangularia verruculosa]
MERNTPETGHDGLIHIPNHPPQTAERNSTTYPEVVHDPQSQSSILPGRLSPSQQQETESSNFPEVTTEQPPLHLEKNYPEVATHDYEHQHHRPPPQQLSSSPPPSTVQYFQAHQQQRPSPVPTPAPTHTTYTAGQGTILAEPRPSGVHSLRDAWSINSGDDVERDPQTGYVPGATGGGSRLRNGHNRHPSGADRSFSGARSSSFGKKPLAKRSIFWVLVMLVAIIIVLAGVLGAVATGKIKTAATTESNPPPQPGDDNGEGGFMLSTYTTGAGKTVSLSCPSAHGLNYTAAVNDRQKVFRRQCGANYAGGDGVLGLVKDDVLSLSGCLDRCAREEKCAGAVFIPKANPDPQCWLKEFLGVRRDGEDMEAGVLWQ